MYGDYQELYKDHPHLYGYKRSYANEAIYFVANFQSIPIHIDLSNDIDLDKTDLLICNYEEISDLKLNAYEARIYLASI